MSVYRGFSKRNLEYMRRFYLEYREADPWVASGVSDAAVSVGQPNLRRRCLRNLSVVAQIITEYGMLKTPSRSRRDP